MDDATDGPYSRAPEIEDVLGLCRALNDAGVRYVLIGGFAVILHGFVRGTRDIDLLVDPSEENVRRLKKAMAALPDNAIAQIEDDDVQKFTVVRVADEVVVDLLGRACGVDFEEAVRERADGHRGRGGPGGLDASPRPDWGHEPARRRGGRGLPQGPARRGGRGMTGPR